VTWDGTPRARQINALSFEISAEAETVASSAPNVVGILEGSDPQLKDEYIVLSAHMDHVGIGNPIDGDSIMNGADDNASGTAAVIEAAEAFALMNPRPKRSIIFLAVSGEEKGLWGSQWYSENPSVPISQIVADVNTDMIGRNWTDTIVAIGKEYSDLGETLDRVNSQHPELNMTAIDDIWPEERFYYRSDHYNFAEKGVPVLFFFNGTHEDYHGVNDEIEKVDAEKATRIVKLMFYLSLEIANNPERPRWKQTG
jgi:Zn-dependent M28 family amino/carboxypeptidase